VSAGKKKMSLHGWSNRQLRCICGRMLLDILSMNKSE